MRRADIDLSAFSISILTEGQHQFNFFESNFGFLAIKGIIPNDWELANSRYTESSFWARYTNGLLLTANARGFHISQRWNQDTGEKHDLSGFLVKYIASIAPDEFRSGVMVWSVVIPFEDPAEWIKGRFFHPEFVSEGWDLSDTVPSFKLEANSMSFDFKFYNRLRMLDETEDEFEPILNVLCRVRHSEFTNDTQLSAWLLEWHNHEEAMFSTLVALIGVENDS